MKRVLKWIGITLGTLVIVAGAAIYGVSEYRLHQTFDIVAAPITVPTDSAGLAAGLEDVTVPVCRARCSSTIRGSPGSLRQTCRRQFADTRTPSLRGCFVTASGRADRAWR